MANIVLIPPAATVSPATTPRMAVRAGAFLLAGRLAAQIAQWTVTLLVVRYLSPDDYGMMTAGTLFVGLADLLAEAGLGRALVQKVGVTADDRAQAFTLQLILATTLYGVLFAGAEVGAVQFGFVDFARFLQVLGLLLFLGPARSVAGAMLERNLWLGRQSAALAAGAAVQAGVVLGLAASGCGYWSLAAGVLLGRSLECGLVCYSSGWVPRLVVPGSAARSLLGYGLCVSGSSILWFVYSNADFAVTGLVLGPVALGYYAVTYQLVTLPVQKVSAHVNQVMFATFCRLQDDPVRLCDWFVRLTAVVSFATTPALIGLAAVAGDFIPLLFGHRWEATVGPLRLLCPVGVLMVTSSAFFQFLNAKGRPDVGLKFSATCLLLFVPAFYLAGATFGLTGVCLTWLLLYPTVFAATVFLTRQVTGLTLRRLIHSQAPVAAGSVVMAVGVATVQWLAGANMAPAGRLAVTIPVGACLYGGWMVLTARGTLLTDLRRLIRETLGRSLPAGPSGPADPCM